MNIAYNIVGRGEPIIFIHGIGSTKHSWDGIIRELKDKYQCIVYDLRGHGESAVCEKNFTLEVLVEDLEKLRSHLNINKTHIVGHSLGGMIGLSYARKYQDKVLSLSLLSTAAFRNVEDQKKILDIINKIRNEGLDKVLPNLINRWFTNEFIYNNQDIINKRIKQVQDTPLTAFLNVFRLYALTEMSSWLNEIKVPCLVITGENDLGCSPDINKKIADILPNSVFEVLDNLKHAITLEAPNIVGRKIRLFIENLSIL